MRQSSRYGGAERQRTAVGQHRLERVVLATRLRDGVYLHNCIEPSVAASERRQGVLRAGMVEVAGAREA